MELAAEKRKEFGKKTQSLRDARCIPAVLFGKGMESVSLTIDYNSFVKIYNQAGETSLVDVAYDNKKEKALIKDVQFDPVTLRPIHASFHKVNLKEKITADIPVEIVGDEENPLVKSGEGLVLVLLSEIAVEALPSDLPSHFIVNMSGISEIGDGITISQLDYDRSKVEIVDYEEDEIVAKIDYATMAEEPEAETVSEEEAIAGVEATEETADDKEEDKSEE
jgi:large subunit ribosomal protein L25